MPKLTEEHSYLQYSQQLPMCTWHLKFQPQWWQLCKMTMICFPPSWIILIACCSFCLQKEWMNPVHNEIFTSITTIICRKGYKFSQNAFQEFFHWWNVKWHIVQWHIKKNVRQFNISALSKLNKHIVFVQDELDYPQGRKKIWNCIEVSHHHAWTTVILVRISTL